MKNKLTLLVLVPLSLTSCTSSDLESESKEAINNSALYDPSSVTTKKGQTYFFAEGTLYGSGRKWYSQAAFSRALSVGNNRNSE